MSVTGPIPGDGGVVVTAIGKACYYCGRAMQDPAVAWAGTGEPLVVHAECVSPWFLRMGRDAHEIQNPAYYARRLRGPR